MKVLAIPVPMSKFNPTTGQWEAPGVDLTPPKKNKVATYQPPTHVVFCGDKEPIAAPWWDDFRNDPMKSWKQQSCRPRQYKHK
jgi:hypothetical protein